MKNGGMNIEKNTVNTGTVTIEAVEQHIKFYTCEIGYEYVSK